MARVTIAYDPDLTRIGKTVEVSDDAEVKRLIREGRVADPDADGTAKTSKATKTTAAKTT